MKMRFYFVLLGICFLMPCTSDATTFPTPNQPFSKYGQIQNVQNYSSNPFWTPDSPYNQRMPVPVYVQGPDVTTADCQRVVSALIESYCASRNNCMDISLTDINPTITVQLASLPGHNFVTPCAAYIQPTFETYKKNNSNAAPTGQAVAFPEALVPNPDVTNNQKNNTDVASPPQKSNWQTEMRAREQELERLQAQNSPGSNEVIKTDFPATFADLSFEQKQQVLASGYAPYKDKSAYKPINNIIDDTTSAQSDASSNNGEAKKEDTKQKGNEETKEQYKSNKDNKNSTNSSSTSDTASDSSQDKKPIIVTQSKNPGLCGRTSVYLNIFQDVDDNEFLYSNSTTYNEAQRQSSSTNNIINLPGNVFECDNDYCTQGTVIYAPAGTVFEETPLQEPKMFVCVTNRRDYWQPLAINKCNINTINANSKKLDINDDNKVYFQPNISLIQYCYLTKDEYTNIQNKK